MCRLIYFYALIFIKVLLYSFVSSSCNSCAAAQKEQKQPSQPPSQQPSQQPSQYYLLADSSILGGVGISPAGDGTHPEILAISELKSKPNKCPLLPSSSLKPTCTSPVSEHFIQTFDPYTTIIKTLYGTHTELSTATQCIPFAAAPVVASTISATQTVVQFASPPQQPQFILPYPSFPPIFNQPLPTSSKCTELLSNNQLLALIHEQMCVGNDRMRQMLNEIISKSAVTSYFTKTILPSFTSTLPICTISTSSVISTFSKQGVIPPSPTSPACMSLCNNGFHQFQIMPPQIRVVVATSTYLLPSYGAFTAPSPSPQYCPFRQAATPDSF
ncbi:hypothetical protein DI09_5p430 [Mitosporidium daphniae]|uniref:Uncharacterized protein n=1 Tax=Mitosporidium daphniae TaxID=1485682 RepID=A0A098VSH9_9MICR|nr:uncharacterized protein DI09_5p430 [Mitosporidium daphniae]KGG50696.1 hypothetical protein DI09_5p430 [Mitosporidium daphniae]|eukprot:XP_013237123.1 uncharacterized protein DI09_5p430 [Mitosporidium daphniae]